MKSMMSVYTPTYNTGKLLLGAYQSLKEQTYENWEWVICDDGSDEETRSFIEIIEKNDCRVKTFFFCNCSSIGLMKRRCTERTQGEFVVELDHDDKLTNNCLQELYNKFLECPDAGMVYSHFAEIDDKGICHKYEAPYWHYRKTPYKGKIYDEALTLDVYGKISEFSDPIIQMWQLMPNHVRAFRRTELMRIGGYDESLIYADDFDLIIRMYLHSKIVCIPKLLYLYRWGENTWHKHNADLQAKMVQVRERYFPRLRLDLGCGPNKAKGFKGVDKVAYDGVDYVIDFARKGLLGVKEESVDEIRAIDFIEHIENKVFTLEEIYRVLKKGAMIYIQVPSTDGRGAFQDPTHVSFWNENSFHNMYMNGEFRYGANYNFKVESLCTTPKDSMGVCWVQVWLRAIKEY